MGACESSATLTERYVLMCGPPSAGKTAILQKLSGKSLTEISPTEELRIEKITHKNLSLDICEVGGHERNDQLRRSCCVNKDGLIFVVDSTDPSFIDTACEQLRTLLHDENLRDVPLLVYANKQDVKFAFNRAEMVDKLGLFTLIKRKWHLQPCSTKDGTGLSEGLNWLRTELISGYRKSIPNLAREPPKDVMKYVDSPRGSLKDRKSI